MSYIKNANYEYITLAGSIHNADGHADADGLNDITGTVITVADGTSYYLDDFIETADGLAVCVIITAADGCSCYDILTGCAFLDIAKKASDVELPYMA